MATEAVMPRSLRRAFITPEGVDLRLELGSAGSRAAAFMIDLVLMVVVLLATNIGLLYIFYGSVNGGSSSGVRLFLALYWFFGFIVIRLFKFSFYVIDR